MKQHGPWQIKSSHVKFQSPWVTLVEDQVVRPNGEHGAYAYFKIVNSNRGVSVVALDNEDFVYLTKEFRYALGADSLEVVSGGMAENEMPLEAAKQELKEELGITAKTWVSLGHVDPFTAFTKHRAFLFLATNLTFETPNRESTEVIESVKVKLEEAVELVMQSKITHGQSCVAILKANEYLKREKA